jgi:26S proteasome regulatory subunit N5
MSLYGTLVKQEADYTSLLDTKIPECEKLVDQGKLQDAIEVLMVLEKQSRLAADAHSVTRILLAVVKFCWKVKNLAALNENLHVMSKKRSQLKQAVTKMVQEACTYVDEIHDMVEKLKLIDTLRTVTAGKIYVEIERARLTKKLALIKENEGKIEEAANILQDLQVETYGSMEKREKIEFLLEQMRYCLLKGDFIRTQIISRKISIRSFVDEAFHDLKLKYYELMIKLDQHESSYFEICKHYKQVYDTPRIQKDILLMKEALKNIVIYLLLSPYDSEQQDFLHRLSLDKHLLELPKYSELLKLIKTEEVINWRSLIEHFEADLKVGSTDVAATDAFKSETGDKRWSDFKTRVVEHNMRIMAKYYTRIYTKRMANLLDLSEEETEEFLSNLVINKTISGKIDRLTGIVTFESAKDPNETLNDWSKNLVTLMNSINKTVHLINKEEMVHAVKN